MKKNQNIRKAINKNAGDFVIVTLYLAIPQIKITEKEIYDILQDADVLNASNKIKDEYKKEIISKLISLKQKNHKPKYLLK